MGRMGSCDTSVTSEPILPWFDWVSCAQGVECLMAKQNKPTLFVVTECCAIMSSGQFFFLKKSPPPLFLLSPSFSPSPLPSSLLFLARWFAPSRRDRSCASLVTWCLADPTNWAKKPRHYNEFFLKNKTIKNRAPNENNQKKNRIPITTYWQK